MTYRPMITVHQRPLPTARHVHTCTSSTTLKHLITTIHPLGAGDPARTEVGMPNGPGDP